MYTDEKDDKRRKRTQMTEEGGRWKRTEEDRAGAKMTEEGMKGRTRTEKDVKRKKMTEMMMED